MTKINIEADTPKVAILMAINTVLAPYLETANVERDRKDTDGNVVETRNPAKDRLEFALRGECNLFWMQLYGNTANAKQAQQYSAYANIEWAEQRLRPLQTKLERGNLNGREEDMHATYLAAKQENMALYRYYLNRFTVAKQLYETIMEKPYSYTPYEKKAVSGTINTNKMMEELGEIAEDDPVFQDQATERTTVNEQAAAETTEENREDAHVA